MSCYSKQILDLFYNIQNTGRIIKPDGIGRAGSKAEGTVIEFSWKVQEERIIDARFRTFGDVNAIAISSVLTSMMIGKSIDEVLSIRAEDILEQLQDNKPNYLYLTDLALSALANTYENYAKKYGEINTNIEHKNIFSENLKENLEKLRNGEAVEGALDNYDLGETVVDEAEAEKQYLQNLNFYEKTVKTNSLEKSLQSIISELQHSPKKKSVATNDEDRRRGRPRKERTPEELEAEQNKILRGRGRPRKERTPEEIEAEKNKGLRGRGRPRKERTPEELELEMTKGLRGRGRPRKERTPEELEAEKNKVLRGRGRPKKAVAFSTPETVLMEPSNDTITETKNTYTSYAVNSFSSLNQITETKHRGRPRKERSPEELETEQNKGLRGRGRPKKERTPEELEAEKNKVIRGRGRPRKVENNSTVVSRNPIHDMINQNIVSGASYMETHYSFKPTNEEIKHRGRPKKERTPEELEAEKNKVIRGRGRPKKVDDIGLKTESVELNINNYISENVAKIDDKFASTEDINNYISSIKNIFNTNTKPVVSETKTEAESNGSKGHRGRPRKERTPEELEAEQNKVVRGRGRPKKDTPFVIQSIKHVTNETAVSGPTNASEPVISTIDEIEKPSDKVETSDPPVIVDNGFAPAQNKYGVGLNTYTIQPTQKVVTVKRVETTTKSYYSNNSSNYTSTVKAVKGTSKEDDSDDDFGEDLFMAKSKETTSQINTDYLNKVETPKSAPVEEKNNKSFADFDDDDVGEIPPLSDDVNKILTSGGSIEEALKALMDK